MYFLTYINSIHTTSLLVDKKLLIHNHFNINSKGVTILLKLSIYILIPLYVAALENPDLQNFPMPTHYPAWP